MNAEQSPALGSGAGGTPFNAGASERSRPLWQGVNAAPTLWSGADHFGAKARRRRNEFGWVRVVRRGLGGKPDARKTPTLVFDL